jgi:hypothetical protein
VDRVEAVGEGDGVTAGDIFGVIDGVSTGVIDGVATDDLEVNVNGVMFEEDAGAELPASSSEMTFFSLPTSPGLASEERTRLSIAAISASS